MTDDQTPGPAPSILTRDDGAAIAYHVLAGKKPGIVFLTGFMSDMTGGKALALESWCRKTDRAFLRFDYTGHGASSGAFADGTIGAWAEDAVFALDKLTQGPQVLVGSSMGGWIMLLAALARPERVAGLLGIAAAPDFTEDLMDGELTQEQRETMEREGRVEIPTDYDDPYVITKALIEDGRNNLLLRSPIALTCPVRLIQGMKDTDVPWKTALAIQDRLTGGDVEVTLVKDGDHRLSEPEDLARLTRTLEGLLEKIEPQDPESP